MKKLAGANGIRPNRKGIVAMFTLLLTACLLGGGTAQAGESRQNVYDSVIAKGWIVAREFDPDAQLTRGQAIKTIMRMAALLPEDLGNLPDFADTADHPDAEIFRKARNYGIVTGGESNRFNPGANVTKMTLVIWLNRTFNLPDTVNFENKAVRDNLKTYNPEGYYAINKYLANKIIDLDQSGKFHPRSGITMGEFALIIDRLDGVGLNELKSLQYEGQPQKEKILSPR
ncbi:MAG: S-layer homology domain-containing protein [Oscillospiraceae bacterium]|jgi:hypothetical protein|nr:S-layer homology domain-containing protein [Oscillospiraceae bacterium]